MAEPRISTVPARIGRRAARLLGYWRSEVRTLRQGLVALVLSTMAGFVAGLTLAGFDETLRDIPGLLVLIPASVGMRGMIFGAMGARLGTQVAAGLFEPNLRPGGPLRSNAEVALVSALITSLYLAVVAKLVASAFGERTASVWDFVTISVVGGTLASLVVLGVTVMLASASYRRGWDLDAVSTPMVTAIGDMVTLPALFLAALLTRIEAVNAVAAALCVIAVAAAVAYAIARGSATTRRILLEMAPIAAFAPLLDIVAGALLDAHLAEFELVPALLILVPPFVSQAGALGGILSSRLTSKLEIGVISPRGRPETPAVVDGTIVVGLGIAVFTLIGVITVALSELTSLQGPAPFTTIGGALVAGLLVLPITLLVGYYVAVATTRLRLDPDNYGVPVITAVMDLAGVSAILFVMSVSGVI